MIRRFASSLMSQAHPLKFRNKNLSTSVAAEVTHNKSQSVTIFSHAILKPMTKSLKSRCSLSVPKQLIPARDWKTSERLLRPNQVEVKLKSLLFWSAASDDCKDVKFEANIHLSLALSSIFSGLKSAEVAKVSSGSFWLHGILHFLTNSWENPGENLKAFITWVH